ncbi:MAG: hypothetical protein H6704_05040 [Myxococcales bacterium]|nr:hypothetical protein [Myxococcales bacterium]
MKQARQIAVLLGLTLGLAGCPQDAADDGDDAPTPDAGGRRRARGRVRRRRLGGRRV